MLLVLLFLTYSILTAPTKEELEKQEQQRKELLKQDSINNLKNTPQPLTLPDSIQDDSSLTQAQKDSLQDLQLRQENNKKYGIFTAAATGKEGQTVLENDKLKITFNNKGGRISKVEVKGFLQYNQKTEDPYDKEPLFLMDNPNNKFEYHIPLVGTARGDISTADLYFEPKLEGKTLRLRAYAADRSKYIEQKYSINDNYLLDYQFTLEGINEDMPRDGKLRLNWESHLHKIEKNPYYEATMTTVYYKSKDDDFNYCDCRSTTAEELSNPVEWVSQSQQFFNTSIFSKEGTTFSNALLKTEVLDHKDKDLKILYSYIVFTIFVNIILL